MQLPIEQIIEKIKEKTSMSEDEINAKIDEKTKQLSGLISREGAGQIIANENNVKLIEEGPMKIDKIVGGLRTVTTTGKVIDKYDINTFTTKDGREGKVGNIMIGDGTGRVRVTFWNDKTDLLSSIEKGDIVRVKDAMSRSNRGRVEVHMTNNASLEKNPEGVQIDNVKENTSSRKAIKDLGENDENVEILATIVQVFEPKFFEVCPECNRRVRSGEDGYNCQEHGKVEPAYSYVMNAQVDDGTGNIRTVFFKNQAKVLMGKSDEEIDLFRTEPTSFDPLKQELLGSFVKLSGRTTRNQMFDRVEFITQFVGKDPDPKEEIKKV